MDRRRVFIGVLFAVLFGLGWWAGSGRATADVYANLDLFVEVLHKIEDNYVDQIEPSQLVEGALKGVLQELDPYSQYLDRKSYSNLQDMTHGRFSGIGVVVGLRDDYPTVISPIEGSPAWQAGLTTGDVIVRIDGKSSAGLTIEEAATMLRGPEGAEVTVTVRREGEEQERDVVLARKEIKTPSVPYAFVLDGGIGYLRLANFSENSGAEVRAAIERMRGEGARSLVLDMRMNPGGLLDQAVDVSEQFLTEGSLVVYTRGRSQGQSNRFYASAARAETRWPMVVLVDHGSASASEIVAGALQDRDRALLIGRTSFGKGSVQSVFPLRGHDGALKLTTALYYTPSGRSIHRAVRDTSASRESEEGEQEGGLPLEPAAPISALPDTAGRPVFMTGGGRHVYGGGGITPDVLIPPDTLPPLTAKVEQRGLALRFASRWVNAHPREQVKAPREEAAWSEFVAFLTAEKASPNPADAKRERESLERALRRELARRRDGDPAAARIALEGDPVLRRAVQVLARARAARDVFALGGKAMLESAPVDRSRSRQADPAARETQGGSKRTRGSGS